MDTMRNRTIRYTGITVVSLYFLYCLATPSDWHFIDGVNLIFHEAGHTIIGILGNEFLAVAGGTILQLLVPFGTAAYFFKTEQRLSSMVALMWAGQSLVNVSVYAGDAQAMSLDLIGGENAIHDWSYMLNALHMIRHTPQVAAGIYMMAAICIVGAIAYAAYVCANITD